MYEDKVKTMPDLEWSRELVTRRAGELAATEHGRQLGLFEEQHRG